jgi:uncharacterized protein YpmS
MSANDKEVTGFKKFWKVLRWFILGALVLVIILMITKPSRPAPELSQTDQKQLSQDFEQKMEHMEEAQQNGESGGHEEFTPEEVNASLSEMSANADAAMGAASAEKVDTKIVGINFVDDEATGQFIVHQYGKDIYITLIGHLSAKDGYANIELTSAKIGNLSVPVSMINPRLQAKLAEPDQHEKLKLPEFIADMRVENGKLVIVEK